MSYLNRKQHKFLIKLSKTDKIYWNILKEPDIKIIMFLNSQNLVDIKRKQNIRINRDTRQAEYYPGEYQSVSISEAGKAYLSERKHLIKEKWVPYIITTAISVLALMKSYGYGVDEIFIWCMQQLKQLLQ